MEVDVVTVILEMAFASRRLELDFVPNSAKFLLHGRVNLSALPHASSEEEPATYIKQYHIPMKVVCRNSFAHLKRLAGRKPEAGNKKKKKKKKKKELNLFISKVIPNG